MTVNTGRLWHVHESNVRQIGWLKRLTSLRVRCRGMLYPHYVGAWDSVAWCKEARMAFRNAIVVCSIPFPNAQCSVRLMVLFSRMRYPLVPGAREGVHKKAQIKGCSLCSVSSVLCWNGRNVAGGPIGSQSLELLMNFKRPFSFKAGCWLTACCLAKHSGGKRRGERRREEQKRVRGKGGAGKVSWHLCRVGIGCPS